MAARGFHLRIRDPIHGTIPLSDAERAVIDSGFFQRLRHVRQLGFGELAYPGASHTRHAHSLGAMHVAARLFDAMTSGAALSDSARARFRGTVRLAMLCHDVGHLPLSHASERVAPMRDALGLPPSLAAKGGRATHEDITAKILLASTLTQTIDDAYRNQGIRAHDACALMMGEPTLLGDTFVEDGIDWAPALRAIVSGELDADRADYLLRDSFFTGVNYGRYDLEWILQNLTVGRRDQAAVMALSPAAVFAFEDFLLSRYHMFLSVYYHHTSVSFDHMLMRFYESGEFTIPADPEAFLQCDDVSLHSRLRTSTNPWAKRIVARQGYTRLAQFTERDRAYDIKALSAALEDAEIEHFSEESQGVLSKYFAQGERPSLYVADRPTDSLRAIDQYTPLYERFGSVRLSRIYVRPDQAARGQKVLAKALGVAGE